MTLQKLLQFVHALRVIIHQRLYYFFSLTGNVVIVLPHSPPPLPLGYSSHPLSHGNASHAYRRRTSRASLSLSWLSRHSPALFSSQETMPRAIPGEWPSRALYPASFLFARNNTRVIPGECVSFSRSPALFSLRKKWDPLRSAGEYSKNRRIPITCLQRERALYELLGGSQFLKEPCRSGSLNIENFFSLYVAIIIC